MFSSNFHNDCSTSNENSWFCSHPIPINNFLISKIEDLPETLIKARILKGYTQKDLADLAGLKEQQIQRYEATNYDSINFGKLIYISNCMGLQFDETKAIIKEDVISVKGIDNDMLRQATIKLHSRKQLLTI